MTTLIGIKTNSGLDRIVLASDNQITRYDKKDNKPVSKHPDRKLYYEDKWAIGIAGVSDYETTKFFGVLRGNKTYGSSEENAKRIIEGAIKNLDFPEINELNKKLRKKGIDLEDLPAFIFAANEPKLTLWWIDEFGNFHKRDEEAEFDYICLGSGEDKASQYIESLIENEKIKKDKITTREAIRIARESIYAAEKDMDTGLGYDLVILTEHEIKSWGDEIKKEIREAEAKKLEDIANYYESLEK